MGGRCQDQQGQDSEGGKQLQRIKWQLLGKEVCFEAWIGLIKVSRNRMTRVLTYAKEDMRSTTDGRQANGKAASASLKVEGFFGFIYQNLAEPMANPDPDKVAEVAEPSMEDEDKEQAPRAVPLGEWLYKDNVVASVAEVPKGGEGKWERLDVGHGGRGEAWREQ